MSPRICRIAVLCVLLAGLFTGCSVKDSQWFEDYYDTLKRYRTVELSNGETTYDFAALREINADIYSWLEIPGTGVDYPVLQNPENDEMYLSVVCDGSLYAGGSIFSQASYNGTDFEDPVTVLYGNTMQDDTMFGSLQMMYSGEEHSAVSEICIYLPDAVYRYTVFTAVQYSDTHILFTYDFSDKYWYTNFFRQIKKIRNIGAWYDDEFAPEYGDRVLILSTSMKDGSAGRYLVMATLQDERAS